MPSGSYTEGHTKTVAAESISRIFAVGSISCTQNTPVREAASSCTAAATSAAISGVSGAPAHNTSCTSGANRCAAATQVGDALLPRDPADERHDGLVRVDAETRRAPNRRGGGSAGYQTSVSIPLRTTCTRLGSSAG